MRFKGRLLIQGSSTYPGKSMTKGIIEIFTALIDGGSYFAVKTVMKKLKKGDDIGGMILGIEKFASKTIISDSSDFPKATPSVTKTLLGDRSTFDSFFLLDTTQQMEWGRMVGHRK